MATAMLPTRREVRLLEKAVTPSPERRFRPDIEGLRGIAVLLVVLYHAGLPGLPGGYVGVDVFFVISGFLITSHLTDRVKGPPKLRDFYAKRIRRLLPSALLVLTVTVAASRLFGPVLQSTSVARDGLAAATLSINYHFAASGLNYLQNTGSPSPLLHFWSLSVEEQFYLGWPLLMTLVIVATRRARAALRTVLLVTVISVVVVVSFLACVSLTQNNAPLGYFSLQSRAWELGAGALIAVSAPGLRHVPAFLAIPLGWIGMALIIGSALVLNDASNFPGALAAIPVAGAVLVILGGLNVHRAGIEGLLKLRWLRFIGSVSYTWYLWHWPALVLAPSLFKVDFNLADKMAMLFVSLWLAVLTSLLLERPLLRGKLSDVPWFRTGFSGALVLALVAGVAIVLPPAVPGVTVGSVTAHAGKGATGGAVAPTVITAASDTPKYPGHCIAQLTVTYAPPCDMEPNGIDRGTALAGRVVLLGDSHAGHWYPVVRSIADLKHQDVEVLNKVGCPLADLSVVNQLLKREYTECSTWRNEVLKRLASEAKPSVIFISSLNHYADNGNHAVTKAWAKTMARLTALNVPIVYLADTPHPPSDIPTCIAANINKWSNCSFPRNLGVIADPLEQSIAASNFKKTIAIDANAQLCPATGPNCPAVIDGIMLYRDDSHMTNTAAQTLTPLVLNEVRKLDPELGY